MSAARRLIAAAAAAAAAAGCVSNRIDTTALDPVALEAGERIALLRRRDGVEPETEASLAACLGRRLRKLGLAVLGEAELADALYPWLEPRLAPSSPGALRRRLEAPLFAERVDSLGVDYWVWLEGITESINRKGSMTCAVGPATGCVGFGMWDRDGDYEAVIWKTGAPDELGRVSSVATGTSVMPAIVLPIPLLARSQTAACRGLARHLGRFFSAGRSGAPRPATDEKTSR